MEGGGEQLGVGERKNCVTLSLFTHAAVLARACGLCALEINCWGWLAAAAFFFVLLVGLWMAYGGRERCVCVCVCVCVVLST
jgi:hypothetical protein